MNSGRKGMAWGIAGGHDDGGDGAVIVGLLAGLVLQAGAVGAVDFVRGEIPGAVQRQEEGPFDGAVGLQHLGRAQVFEYLIVKRQEAFGADRVQGLADLVVAGDLLDAEQSLGVAQALGTLHVSLAGQEGGALREEDREGGRAKQQAGQRPIAVKRRRSGL